MRTDEKLVFELLRHEGGRSTASRLQAIAIRRRIFPPRTARSRLFSALYRLMERGWVRRVGALALSFRRGCRRIVLWEIDRMRLESEAFPEGEISLDTEKTD
ncbi:hypothetical protein [Thermoflexus sp.]|uniref:hypothetical protein n=1 Tax=Thermoflexus sp. TaxID=1969742 RepID=UPI0035E4556C